MERYPICIIGVGPAGRNYLNEIRKDWRLEVVGFTNRSLERRQAVAEATGIPGFESLDDLLAGVEKRPQMAVVATANPTHEPFARMVLDAGLHCFLEKPMGQDHAEAESILAAAKASDRYLQVGFEYRYGSMTARLKELSDQGQFGDLTSIDITDSRGHWWPDRPDTPVEQVWRLNPAIGGGPLLHCGIHELDLLRYYGGEVAEIQAFVGPNSLDFYPEGIPDHLALRLRFASGAVGSFTLYHNIAGTWYRPVPPFQPNYHQVPGHGLDIVMTGSGGSAIAEIYAEQLHLNAFDHDARETRYLRTEHFGHQHPNVSHHNTTKMILDFALHCRDGLGPIDDAEDAYRTTMLGFACEEAVQAAISDGWTSGRVSL